MRGYGFGSRRRAPKATPLSRRIVRIAQARGLEFPGGEDNYYIHRSRAGWAMRAAGAWSWWLDPIDPSTRNYPSVGSQWPAKMVREDWELGRTWGPDWSFDPPPSTGE